MGATQGAGRRNKGAQGELEAARIITEWWRQIEPGCAFKRTPSSGGWGDKKVRGDFKVAGDLCTRAKHWPFTVEVKRREGWSFGTLAKGKLSPVWEWWRQCIEAAAEEDGVPMLWVRKNRQPWLVMLPERLIVPILTRHGLQPDVVFNRLSPQVDDGDIRPALVLASKLLELPPTVFLSRGQRAALVRA